MRLSIPKRWPGIAYAYEHSGNPDKALEVLQPFLDQRAETAAMALVCATVLRQRGEYEQAVETAQRHVGDAEADASTRRGLYFVIGLSLERLGEYAKAFEAYKMANAIDPPSFDPDEFDREIDAVIEVFSAKNLAKIPRSTNNSDKPIFISCRPRSGSTLIERILGSHPQIHAAGEINSLVQIRELLPTCSVRGVRDSRHVGARGIMAANQESPSYLKGLDQLKMVADVEATLRASSDQVEIYPQCVLGLDQRAVDQLAAIYHRELKKHSASARRVTNKHLQNWLYLGLIDVLFPGARIIDVRRAAIDNCLACYTIALGPQFPIQLQPGTSRASSPRLRAADGSLARRSSSADFDRQLRGCCGRSRKLVTSNDQVLRT
jgi:tetratricopeptide (TPR) repeat protein